MLYSDLYNFANSTDGDFVPVQSLKREIERNHGEVERVDFWRCELDPNISLGHMVFERDRTSPYDAPFTVASIRFDKRQNRCWSRYICCKELMHVFDNVQESVSTRERFFQLMSELEAKVMKGDMSEMFSSELTAEWMALLVLCPKRLRDFWKPQFDDRKVSNYDVALSLRIPEMTVKAVMHEYYNTALKNLVG